MRNIPIVLDGSTIQVSEYHTKLIRQVITDNGGKLLRAHIVLSLPESAKERRFVMGGLNKLIVYYDGNDWTDSKVCKKTFEIFMEENFPEAQKILGKIRLVGKSSKGKKMLDAVCNRMIDYLVEQYGLEYTSKVLDPNNFKYYRDELRSDVNNPWPDYISYAEAMKWINREKMI